MTMWLFPLVRLRGNAPRGPGRSRANLQHLGFDAGWYGVMAGTTLAFLTVYATRLGATEGQLGVIVAGPALVSLILSVPAGRGLEGKPLIRTTLVSSLWHRAGFALLVPLPWLLPPAAQVWAIVALTLLAAIPGTTLAIAFNALYAELVPPDWRAAVTARRNAILAITVLAASLLAGLALERLPFPVNYSLVFGAGLLGAFASSYHVSRLGPERQSTPARRRAVPLHDPTRPGLHRSFDAIRHPGGLRWLAREGAEDWLRLDLLRGPYGTFLLSMLAFYACQYIPVPLYPAFWVRDLALSDGAISVGNALHFALMTLASVGVRRLNHRVGARALLLLGALTYGLYPLLTALARDATLFWVASALGGLIWAITSSGLINRLMEQVPEEDRPAHMALHNLTLNLGILLGALLGPALRSWMPLRQALLLSAALRLLAGLFIGLWA